MGPAMRNASGSLTSPEPSGEVVPPPPPYPPVYYPSDDPIKRGTRWHQDRAKVSPTVLLPRQMTNCGEPSAVDEVIVDDRKSLSGALVVRAEEALIVLLVLVLWVGAIILFFNRWGKIRMLEPYQPKFHQEHRPSCPMADMTSVNQHRTSFSKYNVSCLETPVFGAVGPSYRSLLRPRQNSVFVGSTITVKVNPPRKTKSAMDLQSLVRREPSPGLTRSMQPLSTGLSVERRTSCVALNRARRPSHLSDLLPPGAFTQARERRPSFNSVLAQVTAERRPSSSMLRISNV